MAQLLLQPGGGQLLLQGGGDLLLQPYVPDPPPIGGGDGYGFGPPLDPYEDVEELPPAPPAPVSFSLSHTASSASLRGAHRFYLDPPENLAIPRLSANQSLELSPGVSARCSFYFGLDSLQNLDDEAIAAALLALE